MRLFWRLMGDGIDWMIGVALWVAQSARRRRAHARRSGPARCWLDGGSLLSVLLRTPLRWSGGVLVVAACLWALLTPQPGRAGRRGRAGAAFRGPDGRLAILRSGRDTFAVKEWLAADGDARLPKDQTL